MFQLQLVLVLLDITQLMELPISHQIAINVLPISQFLPVKLNLEAINLIIGQLLANKLKLTQFNQTSLNVLQLQTQPINVLSVKMESVLQLKMDFM